MDSSQDKIFFAFEGDNWFKRNKESLDRFDLEQDLPLKLINLYDLRPRNVLEVGAANGYRLAAISKRCGARAVGIESSLKAILDGKSRFGEVEFIRGTADSIPLQERFDLIIINFVFCWIDRINLLRSIAEIDRLLADGGFLVIGDFYPSNFAKVRYHHLPEHEVYTYKQNYAATFVASALYHLVGLFTGGHTSKALSGDVSEDDRTGAWLLRKMLRGA